MAQKWHQKATVQAALVTGMFLLVAAVVTGLFSYLVNDRDKILIESGNTVVLDATPHPAQGPRKQNKIVFVTSEKRPANFGGLATADVICKNLARKAGYSGDFLAWLSDSNVGPSDRFKASSVEYVLPSTKRVAASMESILRCTSGMECLEHPINEHENGAPVEIPINFNSPEHRIWTATTSRGRPVGNSCHNWSEAVGTPSGANNTVVSLGDPRMTDLSWTQSYSVNCDTGLELAFYCFEQ